MQTQVRTMFRGAAALLLAASLVGACGAKASPTPGSSAGGETGAGASGLAGPDGSFGADASGMAGTGAGGSLAPGDSTGGGTGVGGGAGTGGSGGGLNPGTGTSNSSGMLGQLEQAYESVVEKVSPSVVVIETAEGLGSGIVFDAKGNIVTNAHVVGSSTQFRVTLSDGSQAPATLVGTYAANDIAVIRIDPGTITRPGSGASAGPTASAGPAASAAPAASAGPSAPGASAGPSAPTTAGLVPATFADSGRLRVGQIVLAVGNPLGLQSSVTNGIVSSLGRTVVEPGGATIPGMIQTSAAINPGNSGGALVDITGNVVGIPTLAASDPQFGGAAPGIGFAIPANDAKDFANQLIANGRVTNTHRAYLGIRSADVNVDAVLVYGVQEGGPAAQSGIRAGDLITAIDGRDTPSAADLSAILARLQPGQTVAVEVVRQDGTRTAIRVILGQLPG